MTNYKFYSYKEIYPRFSSLFSFLDLIIFALKHFLFNNSLPSYAKLYLRPWINFWFIRIFDRYYNMIFKKKKFSRISRWLSTVPKVEKVAHFGKKFFEGTGTKRHEFDIYDFSGRYYYSSFLTTWEYYGKFTENFYIH